jgi:REP element-mobilizing transposase RayT
MGHSYTELFYHFVWATKGREPYITPELEPELFRQIRGKCAELKVIIHALNGMPDHVHLCCTLPTTLCIADVLEKIKGSSSHFVNRELMNGSVLYWQPGYGALTVSKHHLGRVVGYIDNQKQHHAEQTLSAKLERTEELSPL